MESSPSESGQILRHKMKPSYVKPKVSANVAMDQAFREQLHSSAVRSHLPDNHS